jgi:CRP-like cAMP-binding protein
VELLEEVEALKRVALFSKLEPSKLKLLAFTSESQAFDDGEILFHVGEPADAAYVIMEGGVDIMAETDRGEVVAGTLGVGELVGEMGVLTNAARSATIRARDGLVAMRISDEMFLKLLAENAEVALDVMRRLSEKLQRAHHQYERLRSRLQLFEGDGACAAPPP